MKAFHDQVLKNKYWKHFITRC